MLCYTMLCMRDLASDLVPPYGRLRLISNVISRHVQIVCKAYPIACIVCCRDTWFLSQQWAEPQIACSILGFLASTQIQIADRLGVSFTAAISSCFGFCSLLCSRCLSLVLVDRVTLAFGLGE